jgi:hypothetical protein
VVTGRKEALGFDKFFAWVWTWGLDLFLKVLYTSDKVKVVKRKCQRCNQDISRCHYSLLHYSEVLSDLMT